MSKEQIPMESHRYTWAGWTAAPVGLYWTRGQYAVTTYTEGKKRGYLICRERTEIARVSTWAEVEATTDRRKTPAPLARIVAIIQHDRDRDNSDDAAKEDLQDFDQIVEVLQEAGLIA